MALSELKTMFVKLTPGGYFFSVPQLAFARIIKIVRGTTHYHFEGGASAVGKRVRFVKSEGKFVFDSTNTFSSGEKAFIIYKDPLPS